MPGPQTQHYYLLTYLLTCMPQLVPDCVKRWLGDEAEGTAQYSLLNTPKWRAIARLIGTCSGEYMRVAVPPSDAPLASAGGLDNDSARSLDVSAVPSNDEDQARYGEI